MSGILDRHRCGAAAAAVALCLGGCAYPPAVLDGRAFSALQPAQAVLAEPAGELVRWGGTIAAVHPAETETCVDVVARPLDARARPVLGDATLGRFRACAAGFHDPEIYSVGRRVTAVGTVVAREPQTIGDHELQVPRLSAEVLYLWPDPPLLYSYPPYSPYLLYPYAYPYYGPSWGWGFGWGWPSWGWGWGRPYWGRGRPFSGYGGVAPKPPPRRLN